MRLPLLLAALLSTACATQQSRDLDALLRGYEREGFSGTVLVAKEGRVILHEGYGFADRERRIRNAPDTLYEVASLNKTFTAAAILQLQARGALRTTDPISRYLGEFPPPKDAATIHHLATHTAGLVVEGTDTGEGIDRDAFIETIKRIPAESKPGERYRYTNAGYSVMAAIIEKVSALPYETYIRQNLFRDVYFRGEATPRPVARGYAGSPAKPIEPPPMRWGLRGAGGMIATTGDMYRWLLALQRDPVMKPMFEERPEEEGYGWHVDRDASGRRRIHKGGGMPQYATQILWYRDDRLVIIWMSNSLERRWRQTLNDAIPALLLGH